MGLCASSSRTQILIADAFKANAFKLHCDVRSSTLHSGRPGRFRGRVAGASYTLCVRLGQDMRSFLVRLAISAVALSVAGCGTYGNYSSGAQQEADHIQSVSAQYGSASQYCNQKIADNPDYAPLKAKTSLDTPPQFTLQMLNDKTSPNKKEISLLYRVYGDRQQCRKIYLDGAAQMSPLLLNVLVENYSDGDKLWAQATAGRLTWGQFNQSRKDINTQGQQREIQVTAQINSQLQQQHQAELAQQQLAQQQARAAAIAGLANGLQNASNAYGRAAAATSTYQPPPPPPMEPSCAEGYRCMGRTLQADGVWR